MAFILKLPPNKDCRIHVVHKTFQGHVVTFPGFHYLASFSISTITRESRIHNLLIGKIIMNVYKMRNGT